MTADTLTLSSGPLSLELVPSVGGAISNLTWVAHDSAVPILRRSHTPLEKVLDAASFPLVPFSNRIRGGCFSFRGEQVRLQPNMAGDPSPLHGQGWTSAWSVDTASADEALLRFRHDRGEWPWAYEARQEIRLTAEALEMTIFCRNLSEAPMPCGLGFHPYFPCSAGTRVQTQVQEVWTVDENVLPVSRAPAVGRYDIGDSPVCGRGLDNGYGGWSGVALFRDPDWPFELELSSPAARFFQLYSPASGGLFVAEPVSHANAALNEPEEDWAALGLRILAPGEETDFGMRLSVRGLG